MALPIEAARPFFQSVDCCFVLVRKRCGDIDGQFGATPPRGRVFSATPDAKFGRESKPRSHWLYVTDLSESTGAAIGPHRRD